MGIDKLRLFIGNFKRTIRKNILFSIYLVTISWFLWHTL